MQEHPYQLHGQPCPRRATRIAFTALLSGLRLEDAPRVVYSCLSRCCGYVPDLQKTVHDEEKLKPEGTGTEDREAEWVVWKCATEEMRELILCRRLSAVGALSRGRVDVFQPSGR